MSEKPPHMLTLSEASARIRSGALSPVDLVEDCLHRIEQLNPTLNAFLAVLDESARREARLAADALRRGEVWGTLHGIPIGVKDIIDVAGVITTAGSDFLRENVAAEDAPVVRQLRAAGAIIIGKTHLHEFAIGVTNVNPHYGPARNPWNIEFSPGGSSGGSGAAVAAGLCPGALGTDTGGSVRVPAALCGLTGLRPAPGQVSTEGVIPLSWPLDSVGPLAHSAQDAALLLDAIDTQTAARSAGEIDRPVAGLRFGVPADDFFWQETEIVIVAAVRGAMDQLSRLGLQAVDVSLPGAAGALHAVRVISGGDAAAYHRERLASEPERFGPDVRARLEIGMRNSAADYGAARQVERAWRQQLHSLLQDTVDILVMPTTPVVGYQIKGIDNVPAARELLRFTYPISLAGLAALSMPCGVSDDGLPIGVQLVGRETGTLLAVAHTYQQATDWHLRRPAI